MNYKDFTLGDWIGHISGVIEDESELDGNEMRDLVEFLSRLPKWIPVSEKLPDKYTYTLWCASSGYVRSDYFNGEFWVDAKKYDYEVIAWMPLPKPYKGEREDEK